MTPNHVPSLICFVQETLKMHWAQHIMSPRTCSKNRAQGVIDPPAPALTSSITVCAITSYVRLPKKPRESEGNLKDMGTDWYGSIGKVPNMGSWTSHIIPPKIYLFIWGMFTRDTGPWLTHSNINIGGSWQLFLISLESVLLRFWSELYRCCGTKQVVYGKNAQPIFWNWLKRSCHAPLFDWRNYEVGNVRIWMLCLHRAGHVAWIIELDQLAHVNVRFFSWGYLQTWVPPSLLKWMFAVGKQPHLSSSISNSDHLHCVFLNIITWSSEYLSSSISNIEINCHLAIQRFKHCSCNIATRKFNKPLSAVELSGIAVASCAAEAIWNLPNKTTVVWLKNLFGW